MFAQTRSSVRWSTLALVALLTVTTVAPIPTLAQESLAPGAVATNAAGEAVLIRSTPGYDAAAAGELAPGAEVTVSDYPVTAADGSLWYPVAGGYVPAYSIGTATPTPAAAPEVTNQVSGYYDQTGAWIEESSAATTAAAPEAQPSGYLDANGTWVDTTGQAVPTDQATGYYDQYGNWVDPTAGNATAQQPAPDQSSGYYDQNGNWVDTSNLGQVSGTVVYDAAAGASNTSTAPAAAPIGTAYVAGTNGTGATCRAGADEAAASLGVVAEGTAVEVTGGVVGEWQPVNCNGGSGYINLAFIAWEPPSTAATTQPAPAATTEVAASDPATSEVASYRRNRNNRRNRDTAPAASNTGQAIASFARQYEGYPYVFGAAGPNAFDCSGFTQWVFRNAAGIELSRDIFAQYEQGTPVARSQLQPGDMVFFQNTYQPGLSHSGIYLGGGLMIHAENEQTGVKISDINSDYYSSRWFGAVR